MGNFKKFGTRFWRLPPEPCAKFHNISSQISNSIKHVMLTIEVGHFVGFDFWWPKCHEFVAGSSIWLRPQRGSMHTKQPYYCFICSFVANLGSESDFMWKKQLTLAILVGFYRTLYAYNHLLLPNVLVTTSQIKLIISFWHLFYIHCKK